jgi:RNA polymerase sigma-70 factor (ECF subfamily)
MFRLARRLLGDNAEAEDAVQDAFLRLAKSAERATHFVSARAFVFRVVRNVCLDRLRARTRQTKVFAEYDQYSDGPVATPETDVIVADHIGRIVRAMNVLPEVEAEALSLVVFDGLSYQEVAATTDVPIGTVRSRLSRARRTLRAALSETSSCSPVSSGAQNVVGLPRAR